MSTRFRLLVHLFISFLILTARYLQVGHITPGAGVIAGSMAYIVTSLISEWLNRRRRKAGAA